MLEIPAEHLVLGPDRRLGPGRAQASDQPRDPVGGLERLVAVALDMERGLDEMPPPFGAGVHALRGLRRALVVLVENQHELLRRIAVFGAELVDPLDRLQKHPRIKAVGIVLLRRGRLCVSRHGGRTRRAPRSCSAAGW